jgi:hypothetical protein
MGASGVTYVSTANHLANCGTDPATGALLGLQVWNLDGTPDSAQPVDGTAAGIAIGAAVLAVLTAAFCVKVVRRFIESSGEA